MPARFARVLDATVERRVRELMVQLRGGSWTVRVRGDDVSVRRGARAAPAADAAALQRAKDEALRVCRYRSDLSVGKHALRQVVTRSVPFALVQLWWTRLCSTTEVLSRSMRVKPPKPGALPRPTPGMVFADPGAKVDLLLRAIRSDGGFLCPGWPVPAGPDPDLWLRFGADGVPLWGYSVTSVTCSVSSLVTNGARQQWTEQSAAAWALLALGNRGESRDIFYQLVVETGVAALSEQLDGMPWTMRCRLGHDHKVRLCSFWVGDHMFLHKLAGASGVASALPVQHPCPWCDGTPAQTADLGFKLPWPTRPKDRAMVSLEVRKLLPDPLHGLNNVVNTCVLRATMRLLHGRGHNPAVKALEGLDGTITGTLRFVKEGLFSRAVREVHEATERSPHVGVAYQLLWETLREQVALLWQHAPLDPAQVSRFAHLGAQFRKCAEAVQLQRTMWLHVWAHHVPGLMTTWGTLYHAIGHGFEGRHRLLKLQVRNSTRSSWSADKKTCGFAAVVRRDNARLALLTLPEGAWSARPRCARDHVSLAVYAAAMAAVPKSLRAVSFPPYHIVIYLSRKTPENTLRNHAPKTRSENTLRKYASKTRWEKTQKSPIKPPGIQEGLAG
jgi:hypothetical protein